MVNRKQTEKKKAANIKKTKTIGKRSKKSPPKKSLKK